MLELAPLVVVAVLALAGYASWLAQRLDRLHARVDAAWASLETQLSRRARAAQALAERAGGSVLAADRAEKIVAAATAARAAPPVEREAAENDLSRQLHAAQLPEPPPEELAPALRELQLAATRVGVARRFYNDAALNTQALRRRRAVRWLRLAGHAPLPQCFEIDDTPYMPPL